VAPSEVEGHRAPDHPGAEQDDSGHGVRF
jgi:hypothetical protein